MEDARQPILDALSKASEQGLRTGFIVNSSMGTIVGTVYPKSADVEPPPRGEKVYAVGNSLGIQDALQSLNLESSSELRGKEHPQQASPARAGPKKPTTVDIDDCGTALARQNSRIMPPQGSSLEAPSGSMGLERSGFGATPGFEEDSRLMTRSEINARSQAAFTAASVLRPDFLVNTAAAMRESRRYGGYSGYAPASSFQPPACKSPFPPLAATPVGVSTFQPLAAPAYGSSLTATAYGSSFQMAAASPVGASSVQPLFASPVGVMSPAQPMEQTLARQDTRLRLMQNSFESEQPMLSATRGAMSSAVPATPRRAPLQAGTQSMVNLQPLSSIRATSPSLELDMCNQLPGPSYARCVSARSSLNVGCTIPPPRQRLGLCLDDISQGPLPAAFSQGTLHPHPSSPRFTMQGVVSKPLLRTVSPTRDRSPPPMTIQGLAAQTQERVLLRAVSPPRQRSPSPVRRQQMGANDVNEDLLNAQSRLLQSLRSAEMYLAKMS